MVRLIILLLRYHTLVTSNLLFTEVAFQFSDTLAKAALVHPSLIKTAIAAAAKVGLPKEKLFLFDKERAESVDGIKDWQDMIGTEIESQEWQWERLATQESQSRVATINYSSGFVLYLFYAANLE